MAGTWYMQTTHHLVHLDYFPSASYFHPICIHPCLASHYVNACTLYLCLISCWPMPRLCWMILGAKWKFWIWLMIFQVDLWCMDGHYIYASSFKRRAKNQEAVISTSLKDFKIICSFTWVFAGSVVGIGQGVKLKWPFLLCMFRQVCHQTLNEAVVWCAWCLWHIVHILCASHHEDCRWDWSAEVLLF